MRFIIAPLLCCAIAGSTETAFLLQDIHSVSPQAAQASNPPTTAVWETWLRERSASESVILAIGSAAEQTNIDPIDLCAIGHVESNNAHFTKDGKVKRGDGGLAIGWGQVHRSPWQSYFRKELDNPNLDLDVLRDNILVSAQILLYSGYESDRMRSFARYNGGPNPNFAYARKVDKISREIQ